MLPSLRASPALLAPLLAVLLAPVSPGCFGVSTGDPCEDYCDYVCACHQGEEGFDCDQCRTEFSDADPALQDECETSLVDLQTEDDENGTGCTDVADDTGL